MPVNQQIRVRKEDAERIDYISSQWGKPKTEVIRMALDALEQAGISPTISRREAAMNYLRRQLGTLSAGDRVVLLARKDPAHPSELLYTVTSHDPNDPALPPWSIPPLPDSKAIITKQEAWAVVESNKFPWE